MNSARESARERFLQAARTVYVIECNRPGYYYVGMTTNLKRRLEQHRTGKGSSVFVKEHGGLKQLLQTYPVEGRASARRLEHAVTLRMIAVYGQAYVGGSNL
jgi:predicted GIY-YIG superfamily endonuclease